MVPRTCLSFATQASQSLSTEISLLFKSRKLSKIILAETEGLLRSAGRSGGSSQCRQKISDSLLGVTSGEEW